MKKLRYAVLGVVLCATAAYASMIVHGQLVDAALENLSSAPTSHTGRVYFDTTLNTAQVYNGSAWSGLGGGAGGEKNYILTGTSTQTGWAFGSGLVTNVTTTSAAELPEATVGTGIKFAAGSAADYGAFCWTMDKSDFNKKMKVQFSQLAIATGTAYVAGDFAVEIHSHAGALCTSTDTKLALSTDVSGLSSLPNLTGVYRTTFDSGGSGLPSYDIRIVRKASTSAIVLSSVVVGPGVVTQGAAVSAWTAYTPTISSTTGLSASTVQFYWRRVGDSMQIHFLYGGFGGDGTDATTWTFALPTGYTQAIPNASSNPMVGFAEVRYVSGSTAPYASLTWINSSTGIAVVRSEVTPSASLGTGFGTTAARISTLHGELTIPIAEWSGNGTVNVVQNDRQYYYGTGGTWGTSATITTAQGPAGVLGGTTTPGGTRFAYTFAPTTKVPVGAVPSMEVSTDQINWSTVPSIQVPEANIDTFRFDGTNYIGAAANLDTSGNIVANFGKYAAGTASAWTGTWYWRVSVGLPGQAVGFGNVTQTGAGLVQSAGQLLGTNTNDSAAAGNVGEFLENASSVSLASAATGVAATVTLTAGNWDISAGVYVNQVTGLAATQFSLNGAGGTSIGGTKGQNSMQIISSATIDSSGDIPAQRVTVAAGATSVYNLNVKPSSNSSNCTVNGFIHAVRVR